MFVLGTKLTWWLLLQVELANTQRWVEAWCFRFGWIRLHYLGLVTHGDLAEKRRSSSIFLTNFTKHRPYASSACPTESLKRHLLFLRGPSRKSLWLLHCNHYNHYFAITYEQINYRYCSQLLLLGNSFAIMDYLPEVFDHRESSPPLQAVFFKRVDENEDVYLDPLSQ